MFRSNLPAVTSQIPRDLRLFIDRVRELLPAAVNQKDLATQQASVAELTRRAAQLSATLSVATTKIDGAVAALAATVAAEDARLAAQINATGGNLSAELLDIRRGVSALSATVQALGASQTATEQALDTLNDALGTLEALSLATRLDALETITSQPNVIADAATDTGVMPSVVLTLPAGPVAVQVTTMANLSPAVDATAVGASLTCAFNGVTSPPSVVNQAGGGSLVSSLTWVFVDTIETAGDYTVTATLADLTTNTQVDVTTITAVAAAC